MAAPLPTSTDPLMPYPELEGLAARYTIVLATRGNLQPRGQGMRGAWAAGLAGPGLSPRIISGACIAKEGMQLYAEGIVGGCRHISREIASAPDEKLLVITPLAPHRWERRLDQVVGTRERGWRRSDGQKASAPELWERVLVLRERPGLEFSDAIPPGFWRLIEAAEEIRGPADHLDDAKVFAAIRGARKRP